MNSFPNFFVTYPVVFPLGNFCFSHENLIFIFHLIIFTKIPTFFHLRQLGQLAAPYRIQFKIYCLTYKVLNFRSSPTYLRWSLTSNFRPGGRLPKFLIGDYTPSLSQWSSKSFISMLFTYTISLPPIFVIGNFSVLSHLLESNSFK